MKNCRNYWTKLKSSYLVRNKDLTLEKRRHQGRKLNLPCLNLASLCFPLVWRLSAGEELGEFIPLLKYFLNRWYSFVNALYMYPQCTDNPPPPSCTARMLYRMQTWECNHRWVMKKENVSTLQSNFLSANEMFFYCRIWKSSRSQEDCRLPFLNISSSSRVIKVKRWVVSDQKMPEKAVEISQNQYNLWRHVLNR